MSLSGDIKLGTRLFNVVNYDVITTLNEHYIMKLIRATGLDAILPIGDETNQAYILRVHAGVVDTLKLHELLAGYLLPVGKTETDWTLEMAADTAAHIAALTDKEDKAEVHRLGLAVTFDFFAAGLASLQHSQNVLDSMTISPEKSAKTNQPAAH